MKKRIVIFLALAACIFSIGCGMFAGKGDAQKVTESFLDERIQNGGFGQDSYYSDLFWKNTPTAKWENVKKLVTMAHGKPTGFKLLNWQVKSQAKLNDLSGTFVILVYETQYEKGVVTETYTLFKGMKDKKFLILGLHFNSTEIQKMLDRGLEQAVTTDSI